MSDSTSLENTVTGDTDPHNSKNSFRGFIDRFTPPAVRRRFSKVDQNPFPITDSPKTLRPYTKVRSSGGSIPPIDGMVPRKLFGRKQKVNTPDGKDISKEEQSILELVYSLEGKFMKGGYVQTTENGNSINRFIILHSPDGSKEKDIVVGSKEITSFYNPNEKYQTALPWLSYEFVICWTEQDKPNPAREMIRIANVIPNLSRLEESGNRAAVEIRDYGQLDPQHSFIPVMAKELLTYSWSDSTIRTTKSAPSDISKLQEIVDEGIPDLEFTDKTFKLYSDH